jgi:hypothetical protein
VTPARLSAPGATRSCPHCRTTVLESAVRCPQCRKHLRFDPDAAQAARARRTVAPFTVEGTIHPPSGGEAWEYAILLVVRDAQGGEVSRQLMGVGALAPGEARSFALSVEVTTRRPAP